MRRLVRQCGAIAAAALLAGCTQTTNAPRPGFQGMASADEPRAAMVAREILNQGGNAADAATALALTLTVTLPSRASLGSGGACLARAGRPPDPETGFFLYAQKPKLVPPETQIVAFQPVATAPGKPPVPMLAKGLAVLHARLGALRWEQLAARAEAIARSGMTVSRALVRDIAAAGFEVTGPDGRPLKEGDMLVQPALAGALATLRVRGPADLYTGELGAAFAAATGVDPAQLRDAAATLTAARGGEAGDHTIYFAPTPGSAVTEAIWRQASKDRRSGRSDAGQRAAAFAAASEKAERAPISGDTGSTSFVVVDRNGGAVACTLTMGRPFGARTIAGATGIIPAAPLDETPSSGLAMSALMVANQNTGQFVAAMADAGDPAALARIALDALIAERNLEEAMMTRQGVGDEATRVNAAHCPHGLPRDPASCSVEQDPRGYGMATFADTTTMLAR